MRRAVWIVLCVELWSGCVALPEDQEAEWVDSGLDDALVLDGGARRPPVGEPYRGPQCASQDPEHDGDTGLVTSPVDAGAFVEAMTGDAGMGSSVPPANGEPDAAVTPALPGPTGLGDFVITEIMFDPAGRRDDDGEWIELWNARDEALSLADCALDDGGATARKLGEGVVAPLSYVTVARGALAGFTPDIVLPLTLTNTADTVALICGGVEIDRVRYDKSFPLRAGASLSLDPALQTAVDNDDPAAWCQGADDYGGDLGTPGAPNPGCSPADGGVL